MPVLRRRGVLTRDNDMGRYTTPPDSAHVDDNCHPPTSQPGKLLTPSSAVEGSVNDFHTTAEAVEHGENSSVTGVASSPPSRASDDSRQSYGRSASPPIQEASSKHRHFSVLRFRNASDSQLSARLRQASHFEKAPPIPQRRSFCSILHCLPQPILT